MESYLLSKLPFPEVLIPCILEYCPRSRSDWRTCRVHESNLIIELKRSMMDQVGNPNLDIEYWVLDNYTIREVSDWTLFGAKYILLWLIDGGVDRYGRPPRIRPLDKYYRSGDKYKQWYTQSFMCSCYGI
jgi:hypothetical protein